MEFFFNWLMIASLVLLACMSPGPDFIMTVRNSLTYSRRAGIWTAMGFGFAEIIHVSYCIIGIGALIAQSILLFNLLKYAGAAYLLYIGFQALRSKGFHADTDGVPAGKNISDLQALQMGFLTNLLNPKATMFFLALFTQVIDPHTLLSTQILYGATAITVTVLWFSFVSMVLTHRKIKNKFLGCARLIDRICGSVMIAFGLRLALAKAVP